MTTVGVRRSRRLGRGGIRRLAPLAAVATAGVMLLSACGGGSGSGGTSKSLTFWISTVPGQDAGWKKMVAQYKKETGVNLKLVNIPYDGYTTKLHNAAQANSLPDVAAVPALDPIWSSKLLDLSSIANKKSNNINANFLAKDSSGKVLSIPSDVTASGLFINKSLFEKAGVSFPASPSKTWTWTDFIAAANKVREKTGAKYSLTFDQSPSRLRAMVYEMGGKYVHADDSGKFSVDAATKKAVNTFVGWNDDKTMPKSVWTSGADPSAMFQSGDVVAYWSGVWQVASFADSIKKFEWASVPTPAEPVQASDVNSGGMVVGFNNNGDASKAATKFLSWLYEVGPLQGPVRGVRVPAGRERSEPDVSLQVRGGAGGVQALQRGDPALRPDLRLLQQRADELGAEGQEHHRGPDQDGARQGDQRPAVGRQGPAEHRGRLQPAGRRLIAGHQRPGGGVPTPPSGPGRPRDAGLMA